jgi:hypothetical protein
VDQPAAGQVRRQRRAWNGLANIERVGVDNMSFEVDYLHLNKDSERTA